MTTHHPTAVHRPPLARFDSVRRAGVARVETVADRGTAYRPMDLRFGLAALAVAMLAWIISLRDVRLDAMNDLGLLSVLPVTFYVSLGVLTVSFIALLHRGRVGDVVLYSHVGALIIIIHGTPAILYSTLRYSWAWKHVGIVDYIQRNGTVDPDIATLDVYHNWPGFFGASAIISDLSGIDTRSIATWAPTAFSLLDLFALVFVFRMLGTNRRALWLAVWLFFVTNWVGQEYFSPQAMSYFLYLTLVGVALAFFARDGRRIAHQAPTWAPWLLSIGLIVAVVSSHQLTPLMIVVVLGGMSVLRIARTGWLAVFTALFAVLWMLGPADSFFTRNISETLAEVGAPATNSTTGVVDTTEVSSGQATVIVIDRILTVGLIAVAGAGLLFRWLRGHRFRTEMLLLVAPVVLLGATDYDGEALFRVFLFAVPFATLFAAHVVYPHGNEHRSWRAGLVAGGAAVAVLVAFLFAYYGKERFNYFTPGEVAAAEWLYEQAPPNSLLIEGSRNYPSQFVNYENFTYVPISREDEATHARIAADPAGVMADWLDNSAYEATYLFITRSQILEQEALAETPSGFLQSIRDAVEGSSAFEAVFENDDAAVYQLVYEVVITESGAIEIRPVEVDEP